MLAITLPSCYSPATALAPYFYSPPAMAMAHLAPSCYSHAHAHAHAHALLARPPSRFGGKPPPA